MSHWKNRITRVSFKDPTLDLSKLVAGVAEMFDYGGYASTDENQASCAAKVYLAIISAFDQKGTCASLMILTCRSMSALAFSRTAGCHPRLRRPRRRNTPPTTTTRPRPLARLRQTEVITQIYVAALESRPKNTRIAYGPRQKEWRAGCEKQGFDEATRWATLLGGDRGMTGADRCIQVRLAATSPRSFSRRGSLGARRGRAGAAERTRRGRTRTKRPARVPLVADRCTIRGRDDEPVGRPLLIIIIVSTSSKLASTFWRGLQG